MVSTLYFSKLEERRGKEKRMKKKMRMRHLFILGHLARGDQRAWQFTILSAFEGLSRVLYYILLAARWRVRNIFELFSFILSLHHVILTCMHSVVKLFVSYLELEV